MAAAGGDLDFQFEAPNLRKTLDEIAQFSPVLARELRRELRRSGDEIINAQKQILDGPLPGNERATGKRLALIKPKNGRAPYMAIRNIYEDQATGRGGHSGMREAIKRGLVTRVSVGKTRQSISIKTNRKLAPMSIAWQAARFRHPVFQIDDGRAEHWVIQKGQPYFWSPITGRMIHVRQRVADAIDTALNQITQ